MNIHVGVIRSEVTIHADRDAEIIDEGTLFVEPTDGGLLLGTVVFWTVGEDRLRGMLTAAAAGEPIEDIMLALHAAALANGEDTE